jgi:hypothetical protein
MVLSAKHLLPVDHTAFNGRYRPNPPVKDILDDMAERRKIRKEELLSGVNVHIDDMDSLAYRIRTYEEYGATGELLSQDKEENNEQEAKEETENDEKKPRKKTAKKVRRNNKKTIDET